MRAAVFLLLLTGCAAPDVAPPRADAGLEAPRTRSNAYGSFHYVAEIKDAKTTVRVELGWRAPDRAFLRYGSSYAIYHAGGVGHHYLKAGYLRFDAAAELVRIRKDYAGVEIGGEPELAFGLSQWDALVFGRGLRATLGPQRLGARLGWLAELEGWTAEPGRVYRKEPVEIRLREDGFIERAKAGGAVMTAREVKIDVPLDDALFEPPPREGLPDLPPSARDAYARALEDSFRRWALESDPSDRAIGTMVAADVARLYEPAKMAEILKDSLARSLETWRKENPDAKPELLREKLEVDKGKTLGSVEVMEKDIQANFERALDRTFRGMAPPPPRAFMQDVAARWAAATEREIRRQIRDPFERIFDERMR